MRFEAPTELAGRFVSDQRSVLRGEEHVNRYAQGAGETRNAVEGDIPCLALDVRNKTTIQSALKGELFL